VAAGAVRVGIVSDTHGKLPEAALEALGGVDAIIHAGDVEAARGPSRHILDQLRAIAPVVAVRGNCDTSGHEVLLMESANVRFGSARFLVGHQKKHLLRAVDPVAAGIGVVVTGHSHKSHVERVGDVLYVNPGSAGDGRGHGLSVAIVTVASDGSIAAEIVEL
jgi:putative phosphoesterase